MKKLLLSMLLVTVGLWPLRAEKLTDLANWYYDRLEGADLTSHVGVWGDFNRDVPRAEWHEVFARMLELGAKDPDDGSAVFYILASLTAEGPGAAWSVHLERAVLAQAKHHDPDVRAALVETLSTHDKVKYRDLCLSYLDDPAEHVRYRAVGTVGSWPEGASLVKQYVHDHGANPAHAKSVKRAQEVLGLLGQ